MSLPTPPKFFSLAFHTKFFLNFLWRRLRGEEKGPFRQHVLIEFPIAITLCLIAIAAGVPSLLGRGGHRWFWGAIAILGLARISHRKIEKGCLFLA